MEISLDWFTPLTPSQDVCTALMTTAYASLSWKDTLSCQRTTTQLCWPLLKQVRTGGRYGYIVAELGEEIVNVVGMRSMAASPLGTVFLEKAEQL